MNFTEKTLKSELIYNGKIMDVYCDDVEISTGRKTKREVVKKPNAVAVVALKNADTILMIKQYRYPVEETMLELPAGKMDDGEQPLETAKRELAEETGYVSNNWKSLGFIYTSPGFCDEKIFLFLVTDLKYTEAKPDEGEIIECCEYSLKEVFEMIKENQINDSKTIAGLQRCILEGAIKL